MPLGITKDTGHYMGMFSPISFGGQLKIFTGSVAFDNSYPTGGESMDISAFFTALKGIAFEPQGGYMFQYDHAAKKVKAFKNSIGDLFLSYGGKDIKGSVNTDAENADADAEPTNGHAVSAIATVASGAYTKGALTNPDCGRNVCIVIQNDSGGALDLYKGASNFTVTGTWRGAAQTDIITFTSTDANKSVANTKFRYKYGVKPFDTVTNITVDKAPADGLKIGAGLGSKIGLPTNLLTPAAADIVKLTKTAADLATTSIVDTTNMTVNFGTLADGNDFNIVYKAGGEAGNATDLSALAAVRFMAWGY